ncbi:MAG: hypothetical protein WBD41_10665 [Rhodococcus sp. (in: high G+C Gram-positive bacteria)]|jgi:hypothetical protein|nr:hypothetical protein [uncultured Rhodococcus sp.]
MISTRRRTGAAILAVVAAASISVACGTGDTEATPVTTTTQPVLTGPEGVEKSPEQQATDSAIAKIDEFYASRGAVEADPAKAVQELDRVAGGPVLPKVSDDISLRRSQGITSTGAIVVVNSSVTDLSAPKDADGNPIPSPDGAWVKTETCTDISGWITKFPDGSPATLPDRGQFETAQITVRNAVWPDSAGWRVTSLNTLKTDSCTS